MTPNPIRKALSTIRKHQVQCLLMGGQACVFYGAAEFSRDADLAVLCEDRNLNRLRSAIDELHGEVIAVPPFEMDFLLRGHAVHFRCKHLDANGLRIDIMAKMRGVEDFDKLWDRRTTIETEDGEIIDLLGLPDLVRAKKTQRDKDWPMIRRLVEANYFQFRDEPDQNRIGFWLRELRTPSLLLEVISDHPQSLELVKKSRSWLMSAKGVTQDDVEKKLKIEEEMEREVDRKYWQPLKEELETLRHRK